MLGLSMIKGIFGDNVNVLSVKNKDSLNAVYRGIIDANKTYGRSNCVIVGDNAIIDFGDGTCWYLINKCNAEGKMVCAFMHTPIGDTFWHTPEADKDTIIDLANTTKSVGESVCA